MHIFSPCRGGGDAIRFERRSSSLHEIREAEWDSRGSQKADAAKSSSRIKKHGVPDNSCRVKRALNRNNSSGDLDGFFMGSSRS